MRDGRPRCGPGPIVYVSDGYPKLAETFTQRDVRALHAAGLIHSVASLHARGPQDPSPDPLRDPPVEVLAFPLAPSVLLAAIRQLARRPVEALRIAVAVLMPHTRPFSWAWQLRAPLHVAWGAHLAARAPAGSHFHAQFMGAASSVAWVAARLSGGTFSVTAHQDWALPLARPKLRDALVVLAISETTRRDLLALAPETSPERVRLCRLGVDVPARPDVLSVGAARDASSLPLRVIAVGSIGPTKGHDVLVRAIHVAASREVPVELDIVGGGAGLQELEALVADLRLGSRVRLLGARPHAETLERMARADVVALACRITTTGDVDGIPIALMEGMAAGKATLATRVGAIPELIEDGVSGRLVAPDRPEALADALAEFAANPALRARMGEAAREKIVAEFEASSAASRLVAVFERCLAGRIGQESGSTCS